MKQPDWKLWEQSEFKQHDAYEAQGMFGKPIPPPPPTKDANGNTIEVTILPFVWTYLYKEGTIPKAQGTCNGGKRYGKAVTLAHTYASCIKEPGCSRRGPAAPGSEKWRSYTNTSGGACGGREAVRKAKSGGKKNIKQ